jgi:hyperosmotically inducible protein
MKPIKAIIPAAFLGLALAVPAFAQEMSSPAAASSPSASQSMHEAGKEMKSAGSETWSAAKDTGQGAATAITDTKITAKVKRALHKDEATKGADIHVSTSAGVVTLNGSVASRDAAAKAENLAQSTEGVKSVDNKLAVSGSSSSSSMQ